MKRLILGTVVALSALTATGAAEAKGCIKGALVAVSPATWRATA